MRRVRPVVFLLLALAAVPVGPARSAAAQMTCDPCVVGVAADGPGGAAEELLSLLDREIADLVGRVTPVTMPAAKRLTPDGTVDGIRRSVDALLADPVVDLVVAVGPVSSALASGRGVPAKPVVAAFVIDPGLQGLPVQAGDGGGVRVSGVPNLNYVVLSGDHAEEINRFREVGPSSRLAYLLGGALSAASPALTGNLIRRAESLGVDAEVVAVGASADAAAAAVPAGVDAVYLAPLPHLAPADFDRLIRLLHARRLPTFSGRGRADVERGVLAALYRTAEPRRLARRIASHVQRILLGEDAGTLPVDFHRAERLAVNAATARALGVHPGWRVQIEAELLHGELPSAARRLDLASAVRTAVAASHDLAAFDESVAAGLARVGRARAALRPQVSGAVFSGTPGRDFAAQSLGVQPAWYSGTSLGLSQVLYSEEARAAVGVQGHLQRSRESSRAALRLDVAYEAAAAYIDVLRARAFERLYSADVEAVRADRELAESRRLIGVARASEVVRWDIETAVHLRAVVGARARRAAAEAAFNRLLDRPLEESFDAAPVDLDDPALLVTPAVLDRWAGDGPAFSRFSAFMAAEALARSPEIRRLGAAAAAEERAVLAARRASWAPAVAAEADLTGLRYGAVDAAGAGILPLTPPGPFTWTVGISAALPLFDGGARRADLAGVEHRLDGVRSARRAAAARVEERMRSSLHALLSSRLGVELAADAADAARRNLALVADAYGEGDAPALLMIDAQNAAFAAGRLEAGSVYDFLADLMAVQRALGRFGFFMDPSEIAAFHARLRSFTGAEAHRPPALPHLTDSEGELVDETRTNR